MVVFTSFEAIEEKKQVFPFKGTIGNNDIQV